METKYRRRSFKDQHRSDPDRREKHAKKEILETAADNMITAEISEWHQFSTMCARMGFTKWEIVRIRQIWKKKTKQKTPELEGPKKRKPEAVQASLF